MSDWLDAEQRVERAQQLSENHRWEEALAELEAAIAINPNNALWHAQRGYILEELDRDEDASAAYRHSYELDSSDNEVALAYGASLARLGRLSGALEVLEAIAARDSKFEPAYCNRIRVYAELGRHEQAEEVFYLAQQMNDKCPDCFFHMGESLASRGQFDKAIFCWKRAAELAPDYLGVNRRIGAAYRAKGQPDVARDYLLRELREDPGHPDLLHELAELSWEAGDGAGAIARLEHLLELEPEHDAGRVLLGRVLLRTQEPEKALAEFLKLADPSDDDRRRTELDCMIGEALLRLGRFSEAQARLGRGDLTNADPRRLVLLGDANLALNKVNEAADCYRRILAGESRNPFVHHRIAVCLLKTKSPESALDHCKQALEISPDFTQAMYHAALACTRLGRWKEAKSWLTKAAKITPNDESVAALRKNLWWLRLRSVFRPSRG